MSNSTKGAIIGGGAGVIGGANYQQKEAVKAQ